MFGPLRSRRPSAPRRGAWSSHIPRGTSSPAANITRGVPRGYTPHPAAKPKAKPMWTAPHTHRADWEKNQIGKGTGLGKPKGKSKTKAGASKPKDPNEVRANAEARYKYQASIDALGKELDLSHQKDATIKSNWEWYRNYVQGLGNQGQQSYRNLIAANAQSASNDVAGTAAAQAPGQAERNAAQAALGAPQNNSYAGLANIGAQGRAQTASNFGAVLAGVANQGNQALLDKAAASGQYAIADLAKAESERSTIRSKRASLKSERDSFRQARLGELLDAQAAAAEKRYEAELISGDKSAARQTQLEIAALLEQGRNARADAANAVKTGAYSYSHGGSGRGGKGATAAQIAQGRRDFAQAVLSYRRGLNPGRKGGRRSLGGIYNSGIGAGYDPQILKAAADYVTRGRISQGTRQAVYELTGYWVPKVSTRKPKGRTIFDRAK